MKRFHLVPLLLLVAIGGHVAAQSVPMRLNHQGRLFDSAMKPVAGTHRLRFTLYAAAMGGMALWTETQSIEMNDGFYSTTLGAIAPLDPALFSGATLYLSIAVDDDPEMEPREPVDSVPYAVTATNVVGDITPRSVRVGASPVIDQTGRWVGPAIPTVGGSVHRYILAHPSGSGAIAHVTFDAPVAGSALVMAHFATSVRTGVDCHIQSLLAKTAVVPDCNGPASCTTAGYSELWINGNLPTQSGAGPYLTLSQSVSALFPLTAGSNSIYLNGKHNCDDAQWRNVTFSVVLLKDTLPLTFTLDGT